MARARQLEALREAWAIHVFLRAVIYAVVLAVSVLLLLSARRADAGEVPRAAAAYQREYVRIVRSEWGLNAPVATLAAQIHAESGWDCRAVSRAGARGCAQFMPATARWIGTVDRRLANEDLYSPAWAFRAQAVYMRWLHERVKADSPCDRMGFALSAYNGGLGHVYRRQKLSARPGRCFEATCAINPGIAASAQAENEAYPRRILGKLEPKYVRSGWGEGACS